MNLFYIIILVTILIIHLLMIHGNIKRTDTVGAYTATIFSIAFFYEIVPIIFYYNIGAIDVSSFGKFIQSASFEQFLHAEFNILLFTIIFHLVYIKRNNKMLRNYYSMSESKMNASLRFVSNVTYLIGGISFVLYITAFGGVHNLLARAEYLRAFVSSGTEYVSYFQSILVVPARMITVTPIVCLSLLKINDNLKNRWFYIFEFITSMVLSIIFLLSNAGKGPIIIFGLCFIVPLFGKYIKHPWRLSMLFAVIGIPMLDYIDEIFLWFQRGVWNPQKHSILTIMNAFAYPYSNVLNMNNIVNQFGIRWCRDYITGILSIIPGVNFTPSYVATSEYYGGINWARVGGTPIDIITFGYVELYFIGVMIIAFIFGAICGKFDRIIDSLPKSIGYTILSTSIVACIYGYVMSADISGLVRNQFQFYLTGFVLLYSIRRANGKGII